jgi:hypothetical protein
MLSKMASFGIAGLMMAGGTVALAAPAEAAAKKCAIGTWTLTSMAAANVETFEGEEVTTKVNGGAGTKLKITPSAAIYDFSKSKPVFLNVKVDGAAIKGKFVYRKTLRYGIKLTGAAKGTFTPKIKTASGPATVRITSIPPSDVLTGRVASRVKNGNDVFVITSKIDTTCTKKTLTLSQEVKEESGSITTRELNYRRTK